MLEPLVQFHLLVLTINVAVNSMGLMWLIIMSSPVHLILALGSLVVFLASTFFALCLGPADHMAQTAPVRHGRYGLIPS